MEHIRPFIDPSPPLGIEQMIRDDHRKIRALFDFYLDAPPDSRQPLVEQILMCLAAHIERESLLFQAVRKYGSDGRKFIEQAQLEHAEIKVMIRKVQQAEGDDDQALDEFFERRMQMVYAHFMTEEHLLQLIDPWSNG